LENSTKQDESRRIGKRFPTPATFQEYDLGKIGELHVLYTFVSRRIR